jgi:hypothetical protein
MDVTKPYKLIRFGTKDITKPYKFVGFGAMDVTKAHKFNTFSLAESCCMHFSGLIRGGPGPPDIAGLS